MNDTEKRIEELEKRVAALEGQFQEQTQAIIKSINEYQKKNNSKAQLNL